MKPMLMVGLMMVALIGCKKDSAGSGGPAAGTPSAGAPGSGTPGTPATPPSAGGDPACLLGSWVVGENGYTFNADKTGTTTMKAHPVFTWSMKDKTSGVIVLPEHTISESTNAPRTEMEFTADCSANAVTIKGFPAKKSP